MKLLYPLLLLPLIIACNTASDSSEKAPDNPFLVELNVPINYAAVTAEDIEEYGQYSFNKILTDAESIRNQESIVFENVFGVLDGIYNTLNTSSNNCFMLYWVSPDSLSRIKGLEAYQLLDSLATSIYADKGIFDKMLIYRYSDAYELLEGPRKILVDDLILEFEQSGVHLSGEDLEKFIKLNQEINQLTSDYSDNMNASVPPLVLDEQGAEGLPDNFKDTYRNTELQYEIPIINATSRPILNNAIREETRKTYYFMFNNRAADKNLHILDTLVEKRYELAKLMGYDSYAAYNLEPKMARKTETVWNFLYDLVNRVKPKAIADIAKLNAVKFEEAGKGKDNDLKMWDISYCNNQILKEQYKVDHEKIREYLPMEECLKGVFEIYQELFGIRFEKVERASVWHEEVEMYEVYEGKQLMGRFYLDLFPRPNKESWFYGVGLNAGKLHKKSYEVPVSMLLGNFTRPTETLPSLVSHRELNILFHEFGHIIDALSYKGEFALQAESKSDFVESMSQILENWIWDYDILSSFARHYETSEVLPRETFDNLLNAKNVSSGFNTLRTLRACIYDMNLYDTYNPDTPVSTDEIWENIDTELGVMQMYVKGTHPQSSWIHINTHPVYMYGYLWSEVYAQDMFTEFEKNGLTDQETGIRYRKLILANGAQRDVMEAVEEFLGRPSNNEAYVRSLGLD